MNIFIELWNLLIQYSRTFVVFPCKVHTCSALAFKHSLNIEFGKGNSKKKKTVMIHGQTNRSSDAVIINGAFLTATGVNEDEKKGAAEGMSPWCLKQIFLLPVKSVLGHNMSDPVSGLEHQTSSHGKVFLASARRMSLQHCGLAVRFNDSPPHHVEVIRVFYSPFRTQK